MGRKSQIDQLVYLNPRPQKCGMWAACRSSALAKGTPELAAMVERGDVSVSIA